MVFKIFSTRHGSRDVNVFRYILYIGTGIKAHIILDIDQPSNYMCLNTARYSSGKFSIKTKDNPKLQI